MMKQTMQLLIIVLLLFCGSTVFSEEITVKEKDLDKIKNTGREARGGKVLAVWEIHSDERGLVGIIIKEKEKRRDPKITLELFNANENYTGGEIEVETNKNYIGRILSSKELRPKGATLRNTRINEKGAQLYLDALKVIDQIK